MLYLPPFSGVQFTQRYTGPGGWTGGAVTVGAGIQGRELLRLANQQSPKVAIVTGECPVRQAYIFPLLITQSPNCYRLLQTVGFAGGYIQGGGHGPLASYYGMGTLISRAQL